MMAAHGGDISAFSIASIGNSTPGMTTVLFVTRPNEVAIFDRCCRWL